MTDRPRGASTAQLIVVLLSVATAAGVWLSGNVPNEDTVAATPVGSQSPARRQLSPLKAWTRLQQPRPLPLIGDARLLSPEPPVDHGPALPVSPTGHDCDVPPLPAVLPLLVAERVFPGGSGLRSAGPDRPLLRQPEGIFQSPDSPSSVVDGPRLGMPFPQQAPGHVEPPFASAREVDAGPADGPAGEQAPHSLQPPPGVLPLAPPEPEERSRRMESITRQAERHVRRAFDLAARGAYYSARAECVTALCLLAQALDTQQDSDLHSRALATGLRALEEADDLVPHAGTVTADRDLAAVVSSHRTPVLRGMDPRRITPMAALQGYFTFAQEQLGVAQGHWPAGSMTLHTLGKVYWAMLQENDPGVVAAESKAMVFYQAALLVDPQNYPASNDLGVLLARCGRWEDARMVLNHSASLGNQPETSRNLTVVHEQLGEPHLAPEPLPPEPPAEAPSGDVPDVRWMQPEAFARTAGPLWEAYGPGEYLGPPRGEHVPEYRLRVDDELDLVYRVTREETPEPYRLNVGDVIRVESFADPELNRDLIVQPDGTITLRLLGQVRATRRTVAQLRDELEEAYKEYYKVPSMTVTPLRVNSKLEDLRAAVDGGSDSGGQTRAARITPEGTISLPAVGSVRAQGLTLVELQRELNERYRHKIQGIEVVPVLVRRAPRFVYVLGATSRPGRFELRGPTTVLQAIGMAGGWSQEANLRQVVVFRRGEDWRLMGTVVDLRRALHPNQPCPAGDTWVADCDVIVVPRQHVHGCHEFLEGVFTRRCYGPFPLLSPIDFRRLNVL